MKSFWKIISSIFFTLTALIAIFEVFRCGQFVFNSCKTGDYFGYIFLAAGLLLYFIVERLFFRKNLDILQTMSHEGAHMLVGGLFLRRRIYEFHAKSKDSMAPDESNLGFVTIGTKNPNILFYLAPYTLPYLTYILLLIRLMIKDECLPIIDVIIGITLMFYLKVWKKDTRFDQTDLKTCGIFRSVVFIITFVIFNISIILYSMGSVQKAPINVIDAFVMYFKQFYNDILWLISLF